MNETHIISPIAVSTGSQSMLATICTVASIDGVDIGKVHQLFAMHRELLDREAEQNFNAAMARTQSQMVRVISTHKNTQTNSRYAKLADIIEQISPIYTAEGLSISFDSEDCARAGWLRTVAIVSHAGGFSRKYKKDMPNDSVGTRGNANKTEIHGEKSTVTYARTTLICMIFNIPVGEDNDGNGSKNRGLPQENVDAGISALGASASLDDLKKLFDQLYQAAQEVNDTAAMRAFIESKDSSKKRIGLLPLNNTPPFRDIVDDFIFKIQNATTMDGLRAVHKAAISLAVIDAASLKKINEAKNLAKKILGGEK